MPPLLRVLFFIALVGVSYNVYTKTTKTQQIKLEFKRFHSIEHGLLAPDSWKAQIADVLDSKIDDFIFDLKVTSELFNSAEIDLVSELRSGMESIGYIDITNFATSKLNDITNDIRVNNSDILLNQCLDRLEDQIPEIVTKLNTYLNEDRNQLFGFLEDEMSNVSSQDKAAFQQLILNKVNRLIDKNKGKIQTIVKEKVNTAIARIQSTSPTMMPAPPSASESDLYFLEQDQRFWSNMLILLILGGIILYKFTYSTSPPPSIDILLFSLITLLLGISLPMISIEAIIDQVGVNVMGSEIVFKDQQVLYRSKSILEFFHLLFIKSMATIEVGLIKGGKLFIVSISLLLFSVVFPLIKIIASANLGNLSPSFIDVKKLSKWSMTDVFVVAIALAFLGFNGLIDDQLGRLSSRGSVIATNESSLEIGFYVFILYCLISLIFQKKPA